MGVKKEIEKIEVVFIRNKIAHEYFFYRKKSMLYCLLFICMTTFMILFQLGSLVNVVIANNKEWNDIVVIALITSNLLASVILFILIQKRKWEKFRIATESLKQEVFRFITEIRNNPANIDESYRRLCRTENRIEVYLNVNKKLDGKINMENNTAHMKKSIMEYSDDLIYINELLEQITDQNLKFRLAHELVFYAKSARRYKVSYYFFSILTIVLPVFSLMFSVWPGTTVSWQTFASTLCSGGATIAAGLLAFFNAKTHWMNYRRGCETLKQEIANYIEGIDKYSEPATKEKKLIVELEKIMINVAGNWLEGIKERSV